MTKSSHGVASLAAWFVLSATAWAGPSNDSNAVSPPGTDLGKGAASAHENSEPRHNQMIIEGRNIGYTVTPGTLTLRDAEDAPVASMFYVAYAADPKPGNPRPVTFAFNGGPGSSSMWLHLSGLGAFRVDVPGDQSLPPAPYKILPSDSSILDITDLVFLDAIGTGLSRPLGKEKEKEFWTVDADIKAFAKAIRRYLEINNRWNSPKFLIGESYGGLRAAGLAYVLKQQGIDLNGLILVSAALNMSVYGSRSDEEFVRYLPTLAATAWYHGKLADKPANVADFLREVKAFATGPYLAALASGDQLPAPEREHIAEQLSRVTGLSLNFVLQSNLRVPQERFRQELLREQHRSLGQLDARFAGISGDVTAGAPDFDVAETAIRPAFTAALNSYLFGTLGYKTSLTYRPDYYEAISDVWDFRHRQVGEESVTTAAVNLDLASVMRQNPHLRVIELHGYYDMAVPFFGTELDLRHLELDPALRHNLRIVQYESGHMIYIRPEARPSFVRNVRQFYDEALRSP